MVRRGGRLYVQYWLYYPDSNTSWAGSDRIWELLFRSRYPGFHADDWEGYVVRIDAGRERLGARDLARPLAGLQAGGVPQPMGAGQRLDARVARQPRRPHPDGGRVGAPAADAAAHPRPRLRERTTTGEGLRLIPLETLDRRGYRPRDERIRPPWRKPAYGDPENDSS